MVLLNVLFTGCLFFPFWYPPLGIPTIIGFLLIFWCRRKWNNPTANRLFLITATLVLIGCELAWFLLQSFGGRYGVLLVDSVAVILLMGYGLAVAWPSIKQWWKENT